MSINNTTAVAQEAERLSTITGLSRHRAGTVPCVPAVIALDSTVREPTQTQVTDHCTTVLPPDRLLWLRTISIRAVTVNKSVSSMIMTGFTVRTHTWPRCFPLSWVQQTQAQEKGSSKDHKYANMYMICNQRSIKNSIRAAGAIYRLCLSNKCGDVE